MSPESAATSTSGVAAQAEKTQPARKPDARTERWREHRVKVRAEFVDAAFRALDRLGPDASMADIAKEAGAAKPKMYRHFTDKADLYLAVAERIRDSVLENIFGSINLQTQPVRELVTTAIDQYSVVVDTHPNVMRFIVQGHFSSQGDAGGRWLDESRQLAHNVSGMLESAFGSAGDEPRMIEMVLYAVFGATGTATDWWIGPHMDSNRMASREEFVANASAIVWGTITGAAQQMGVAIDPTQPLGAAITGTD